MDDAALMIRLLKRLKVEMNGAVTGAMQERGIVYPLNYGVSVPTIRGIAREYGPSHSLALLLYRQQVRELKLSALFVEDPACVTSEQVREWSRDFTHSEIVELTVMYLFSRSAAAVDLIGEWLSADDVFLRYAGVMMLMRTAGGPLCDGERTLFLLGEADAMLMRRDPEPLIVRGMVNALCHCAMLSDRLQAEIMRLTGRYASSANPRLRELASEVASMVSAG